MTITMTLEEYQYLKEQEYKLNLIKEYGELVKSYLKPYISNKQICDFARIVIAQDFENIKYIVDTETIPS